MPDDVPREVGDEDAHAVAPAQAKADRGQPVSALAHRREELRHMHAADRRGLELQVLRRGERGAGGNEQEQHDGQAEVALHGDDDPRSRRRRARGTFGDPAVEVAEQLQELGPGRRARPLLRRSCHENNTSMTYAPSST